MRHVLTAKLSTLQALFMSGILALSSVYALASTNQDTCPSGKGAACPTTTLSSCTSSCVTGGSEPNCRNTCTIQSNNGGPYPATDLPKCQYSCTTGGNEPVCTSSCYMKTANNVYVGELSRCTTGCYAGYTPQCTSGCVAQSDSYNTADGPAPNCKTSCSAGDSAQTYAPAQINGLTPVMGGLPACTTTCYATGDLPVCTNNCNTSGGQCPKCTANCSCNGEEDDTTEHSDSKKDDDTMQ